MKFKRKYTSQLVTVFIIVAIFSAILGGLTNALSDYLVTAIPQITATLGKEGWALLFAFLGGATGIMVAVFFDRLRPSKPRIFIAHSSQDKELVMRLVHDLQRDGYLVFDPQTMIMAGENVLRELSDAINSSDYIIPLLTESARESRWVRKELEAAQEHGTKIVPLVVGSSDNIPAELSNIKYLRLDNKSYPSAYAKLKKALRGRDTS